MPIIIRKIYQWKVLLPPPLLMHDIHPQHILHNHVEPVCLPICLWIKSCIESQLYPQAYKKLLPKPRSERGIYVLYDLLGNTMQPQYLPYEYLSYLTS